MPATTAESAPEEPAPAQLVAFAAAADWIGGSDFDLRSAGLPKHPRSRRLDAVLDSLASICIRKGKGEVYAVAMQSYEKNDSSAGRKLTLTIAGNSGVPPEVESHLKSVLGQLQKIADGCHKFHKDKGMIYFLRYKEQPPHSDEAIAASRSLVADLKVFLYRHSLEKFTSRIGKRYKAFIDFIGSLEEHNALHGDDAWKTLLVVQKFIMDITKRVQPATEIEYGELVSLLDTLSKDVRGVLKSKTAIDAWVKAVEGKHASLGGVCIFQLTK